MENKEFAPGEEVSSLLKQIAENLGWDPATGKFEREFEIKFKKRVNGIF